MRDGARIWLGTAVFVVLLALVAAAPAGAVDIIEDKLPETVESGWQAGTCTSDTPECVPENPRTVLRSRPRATRKLASRRSSSSTKAPRRTGRALKTVLVDLPQGLSVNPEATPQCELRRKRKIPRRGLSG